MPAALLSTAGAYTYARRRPEATALHQVVRENLLTLYAAIEQGFAAPLPAFVRDEFEGYVDCGVLARGFALLNAKTTRHKCADTRRPLSPPSMRRYRPLATAEVVVWVHTGLTRRLENVVARSRFLSLA
jgi:hypothetical protein